MKEEIEVKPLGIMFEREVTDETKTDTEASSAEHSTVSPDGCIWSDPCG